MQNVLARIAAAVTVSALLSACGPGGQEQAAPSTATNQPATSSVAGVAGPTEFTGVITQMPAAGNCALDILNGMSVTSTLTVKKTDEITLGGWMANSDGQVPTDARFVLQGTAKSYAFPVSGGGVRGDVAEVMKNEALKTAGFDLPLGLSGAQVGTYDLAIVMGGDAGYACPLNIKLVITD